MPGSIIMPKTGMAMEEGTIIRWLKSEGDVVSKGDVLAEIETDKSTMDLESDFDGTILRILREDGETVPVTEVIAWVGEPGEQIPGPARDSSVGPGSAPAGDLSVGPGQRTNPHRGTVRATPAARRLAQERGLDLVTVSPTGPAGEVRVADVDAATATHRPGFHPGPAQDRSRDPAATEATGMAVPPAPGDIRIPLTRVRQITGMRTLASHREIPSVTLHTRADVSDLLETRLSLNQPDQHRFTINDFVLKATVLALQHYPRLNSVLDGTDVVCRSRINLGVAVATDRGLFVPVLQDAGSCGLLEISARVRDIADRARQGRSLADELEGGTFSVSNVGKFGITSFNPIINQPEAAILGVCAVEEELRMVRGTVAARQVMGLSLTFDHRIVDGAEASVFLKSIRDYLEEPFRMLAG